MKKNRQKTGDRSQRLDAQQLAWVRGGGIQGSGHAADNGVISVQKEDGVIHTQ
jgi:hypothetical protein